LQERFARTAKALVGAVVAALVAIGPATANPCAPAAAAAATAGWAAYRSGDLPRARALFEQADRACRASLDSKVGLGYVALQVQESAHAESLFRAVLAADSANGDGWCGLALAASRLGRMREAIEAGRRAWALQPGNADTRILLDRLLPGWERSPHGPRRGPAPHGMVVAARTRGERFEIPTADGWSPFYVKGINLGVALPGRFPSEFPTDSLRYAGWLDTLSAMNANVVRVYTILPPAFYRALAGWNAAHPARTLWLIHGVWTELPPDHDFADSAWSAEFRLEMRRVVDVVHGGAEIPVQSGHAGGLYDADVSRWTLAYLIGREWEPYAVKAFNAAHPGRHAYRGRLLAASESNATEAWMVRQCDLMLTDELDRYRTQRPIAYTNWPTLDPLHHPTESGTEEERAWRRRRGASANYRTVEYENDAESLDPSLVRPTDANLAGWFASYHAYPYYPDFMIHDDAYRATRSSLGPSNYFGYLRALKQHHAGLPVVIAEYGVPSSRGSAHLQPQGWHHGGHDERAMAAADARLTREIHESGMAGGILFAWIDEWFKKNWAVIDLELPPERTRLWHNVMDAEQNYGVLAMVAGSPRGPKLGGDLAAWRALARLSGSAGGESGVTPAALRVGQDPSYLYVAVELQGLVGRAIPWDSMGVMVALDTYRADVGQRALPGHLVEGDLGFEFVVDLSGPDSATLGVTPGYNPYAGLRPGQKDERGRFYQRIVLEKRGDGRFDSLRMITNRARFGRDGRFYPALSYDRGRLRYGTEEGSTLSDWYVDERAGLLEIRLAWGLLNVTDPSTRTVVQGTSGRDFATAVTEGFRLGVVTYEKPTRRVLGALPPLGRQGWKKADFPTWTWEPWEAPPYYQSLKPAYQAVRDAWSRIDAEAPSASAEP
jgi:hypothetical protein